MVVGEDGIQTFKVVVVVLLLLLLLFDVFVQSAHPLIILDMWFVQICFNVRCLYIFFQFNVMDASIAYTIYKYK